MHRRSFFGRLAAGVAAWFGWHSTNGDLHEGVAACCPPTFWTAPVAPGVFPICRADVPNSNGRLYTRKALENLAKRMEGQTVPVVLGGPDLRGSGPVPVERIIGKATLHMEGDYLVAELGCHLPNKEFRTWGDGKGHERNGVLVVDEVIEFRAVVAYSSGDAVNLHPDARPADARPSA